MASFALEPGRSKLAPLGAALACALLAAFWSLSVSDGLAWGWDETMHTGAPAWRMSLALRQLDASAAFDALHDCERYPFVYPVVVAGFQTLFGASQASALVLGTLVWCATLWGVFLLARELTQDAWTPWIALLFAAASPLALSFAGTLMLEIPATCACVFALRAWVRRDVANPSLARARDLAAGACIAVALFTKLNYGCVLVLALVLDTLAAEIGAKRRGEASWFRRRAAQVTLLPALALVWWFVLPLPFGLERAAEHRTAFIEWMGGNQDGAAVDWKRRVLNLATSFAYNPRALLVLAIGACLGLRRVTQPRVRALALVLAVFAFAILRHPFHLPRFLIPLGAALWPLAALGWSNLLPRAKLARAVALVAGIACVAIAPGADTLRLAGALGFLSGVPATRSYQETVFAGFRELGPQRHVQRAGLPRSESDAFLEIVARAVGERDRVAWLDVTEEIAPAGLHLRLWRRGGSPQRALEQLGDTTHVSIGGVDPLWNDAQLAEFAARFDVLLFTEPHSLKGRADREFFAGYVARLEAAGWRRQLAGEVSFTRPNGVLLPVRVFTLRRA